jgi:hypothetical protein
MISTVMSLYLLLTEEVADLLDVIDLCDRFSFEPWMPSSSFETNEMASLDFKLFYSFKTYFYPLFSFSFS